MQKKRVSSKDVAREAGVSQATVSYVINRVEGVKIKQKTRDAVYAAAKKLNYHTDYIAKSMRLRKTMSIGVVSDKTMISHFFMSALEGVRTALLEHNYFITFCVNQGGEIEEADYIRYYFSGLIDGILFLFTPLSPAQEVFLLEREIPFVSVNSPNGNDVKYQVRSSLENALDSAIRDLTGQNRRRIGFISRAGGINGFRFDEYTRAMERHGLEKDRELVCSLGTDEAANEETIGAFLLRNRPEAVFCDTVNTGFLTARRLIVNRLSAPADVSLVTIGTSEHSRLACPALSAIEAPLADMGRQGCGLLFDIIENRAEERRITLDWAYVKRESS